MPAVMDVYVQVPAFWLQALLQHATWSTAAAHEHQLKIADTEAMAVPTTTVTTEEAVLEHLSHCEPEADGNQWQTVGGKNKRTMLAARLAEQRSREVSQRWLREVWNEWRVCREVQQTEQEQKETEGEGGRTKHDAGTKEKPGHKETEGKQAVKTKEEPGHKETESRGTTDKTGENFNNVKRQRRARRAQRAESFSAVAAICGRDFEETLSAVVKEVTDSDSSEDFNRDDSNDGRGDSSAAEETQHNEKEHGRKAIMEKYPNNVQGKPLCDADRQHQKKIMWADEAANSNGSSDDEGEHAQEHASVSNIENKCDDNDGNMTAGRQIQPQFQTGEFCTAVSEVMAREAENLVSQTVAVIVKGMSLEVLEVGKGPSVRVESMIGTSEDGWISVCEGNGKPLVEKIEDTDEEREQRRLKREYLSNIAAEVAAAKLSTVK